MLHDVKWQQDRSVTGSAGEAPEGSRMPETAAAAADAAVVVPSPGEHLSGRALSSSSLLTESSPCVGTSVRHREEQRDSRRGGSGEEREREVEIILRLARREAGGDNQREETREEDKKEEILPLRQANGVLPPLTPKPALPADPWCLWGSHSLATQQQLPSLPQVCPLEHRDLLVSSVKDKPLADLHRCFNMYPSMVPPPHRLSCLT
uniref:Uncharacterized protein n=1 Tax=Chromera velia CCMP2878 TaxID=1169474 RepID=A0A0G4HX85_9ALVE|eukprot:Cvel_9193.t1-p1 / transcript=Cvel_9193.t1 / gene=Cvel_9193 / organism=Chromera_velia_CCMP2878 / gene_product=hypothetical protein / transcript_product=hypothetical protein / location=Cvel_scaffold524:3197-9802(-) / protein_length=206 / sequence_SO=supercontig / SO=protein_coding / is_pseudo=false